MPRSHPVVIEIDDTVDVIEIPGDLARAATAIVPSSGTQRVLELIALLIARLGPETAVPAIEAWLHSSPHLLTEFPESLRQDLVSGTFPGIPPATSF